MSVRVGISVVPASADLDRIRELVRAADGAGLDVIGIQDHPYQARFLDTWALISSLLAQTSRVSMFTDVANLPLRPPAMMAKAAATLDVLSGGRFDLGLGAGAFTEIVARLGGPVRTRGESIDALARPPQADHLDRLLQLVDGLGGGPARSAHADDLLLVPARPEAELEAAAADRVE